jgi:tetratricopeptide (TPR) repeat protein
MADVRNGLRTVDSLFLAGERYGALERMQETFFLGEYTTGVQTYPAQRKRELLELYRLVRELETLMDMKDYAQAREHVDQVKSTASDFPYVNLLSAIQGAQRLSNLSVLSARTALLSENNPEKAEAHIRRATELWPLNPTIQQFSEDLNREANLATQAAALFDEHYEQGNWRAIYARATDYAAAFQQDPERQARAREVIQRLSKIDILIAQATELARQGSGHAAWELLASAAKIDPEDPELARAQTAIAQQVAPFVAALSRAQAARQQQHWLEALNYYLKAQQAYPVSGICREGIEACAQALLKSIGSGSADTQAQPPAPAEAPEA